jgi:hypothetical protein
MLTTEAPIFLASSGKTFEILILEIITRAGYISSSSIRQL